MHIGTCYFWFIKKKNFVLVFSVVEILHFSFFWVVSMETLIEEASNNN